MVAWRPVERRGEYRAGSFAPWYRGGHPEPFGTDGSQAQVIGNAIGTDANGAAQGNDFGTEIIVGFGSILIDVPTKYAHQAGECVI